MSIGSCIRSTPGATSVISSVAGSCSWRRGRSVGGVCSEVLTGGGRDARGPARRARYLSIAARPQWDASDPARDVPGRRRGCAQAPPVLDVDQPCLPRPVRRWLGGRVAPALARLPAPRGRPVDAAPVDAPSSCRRGTRRRRSSACWSVPCGPSSAPGDELVVVDDARAMAPPSWRPGRVRPSSSPATAARVARQGACVRCRCRRHARSVAGAGRRRRQAADRSASTASAARSPAAPRGAGVGAAMARGAPAERAVRASSSTWSRSWAAAASRCSARLDGGRPATHGVRAGARLSTAPPTRRRRPRCARRARRGGRGPRPRRRFAGRTACSPGAPGHDLPHVPGGLAALVSGWTRTWPPVPARTRWWVALRRSVAGSRRWPRRLARLAVALRRLGRAGARRSVVGRRSLRCPASPRLRLPAARAGVSWSCSCLASVAVTLWSAAGRRGSGRPVRVPSDAARRRDEHPLAVVAQLVDALADVVEGPVAARLVRVGRR